MTDLHPAAIALEEANSAIARTKATLAAQKIHRDQLYQELVAAIRFELLMSPESTNVSLAAQFGYSSDNSIRRIRDAIKEKGNDE